MAELLEQRTALEAELAPWEPRSQAGSARTVRGQHIARLAVCCLSRLLRGARALHSTQRPVASSTTTSPPLLPGALRCVPPRDCRALHANWVALATRTP